MMNIIFIYFLIIIVLILGIFNHPLGIGLIIADGFFHSLAGRDVLEKSSPDHVISKFIQAEGFLEVLGLGVSAHRFIGISLILLSLYTIYRVYIKNDSDFITKIYLNIIKPVTLIIIGLAASIKLYYMITSEDGKQPQDKSVAMFRLSD